MDKVADYMYHLGGDLPVTEAWLQKYLDPTSLSKNVLCRAFVGLLASGPEQYPETLMMHISRFEGLKKEYFQVRKLYTYLNNYNKRFNSKTNLF